jgi:sodium transport system permease protein
VNLTQCWVVLRKELIDGIRDRKALGMIALTAILSPLVYVGIQTTVASGRRQADALVVPVAGAEHAPALVAWLRQQTSVEVVPAPADPEAAVRDRTEDVVLVIDEDFGDHMSRAVPAAVRLMSDASRSDAVPKAARVRDLVNRYGAEVTALRLIARGIAPAVAAPVAIEEVEVSSLQQRLASSLFVLPIFFGFAAFMCALPASVDMTAGERERGSLEPLLMNPLSAASAITGKWLAASVFGGGGVLVCTLVTMAAFRLVPWHELGMRYPVALSDATVWRMLALYLPLALLMSALTICLSSLSRSFKEAQASTVVLMPAPVLPLVVTIFLPLSNQPWLAPVPVVGQFALAMDVLRGTQVAPHWYVLAAASTLTAAALVIAFAARLFRRESVVFGG